MTKILVTVSDNIMLDTSITALIEMNSASHETIVEHVSNLLPNHSAVEANIGAQILFRKRGIFKLLNDRATNNFIRQTLPKLIEVASEKEKENKLSNFLRSSSDQILTPSIEQVDESPQQPLTFSNPQKKLKSTKEAKNLKLFSELSSVNKKASSSRLSKFVVTIGVPDLPRRHPGSDDNYHPERDIDQEFLDLLEHGNTTLKYVYQQKGSCPNLIFLRGPLTQSDDPLTREIHSDHTLDFYKKNIENETQFPFEFHFAGHGTPDLLGPLTHEKRVSPEDLANQFDTLLSINGVKDTLMEKAKLGQQLIFNFHTCNSAYVETKHTETADTIKQKIAKNSAIGRFYQEMIKLGYENIKVIGYRGYYQSMTNGSGLRVTDTINQDKSKLSVDAMRALHSIERINRKDVVTLPSDLTWATFPVTLLSALKTDLRYEKA